MRHVLHAHPTPDSLDVAFIGRALPLGMMTLAAHVGGGGSWRRTNMPCVVTRAVAHALSTTSGAFRHAVALVRDAQCRALGVGTPHRAAISSSALGVRFIDDEDGAFRWLEFIARHPELTGQEVKAIMDAADDAEGTLPTTAGRTPRSFVSRHTELRRAGKALVGALPAPPVDGGAYVMVGRPALFGEGAYRVVHLGDGRALVDEGIAMRHCVGTYAQRALAGEVALYALRLPRTIEVATPQRRVNQVRGKANRRASADEAAVVRCWAAERSLVVAADAF